MNRLAELLKRIDLSRFPWKIHLHATTDGNLYILENVLDRDTREPTLLGGLSDYGEVPWAEGEDAVVAWVRAQVHKHVLHELDEVFLVDGVRRFDPHAGEEDHTTALPKIVP